jgi:hypothetical protein
VLLHWQPAGDELGWSDGAHSGAGQLDHWRFLTLIQPHDVYGWLVEYQVDLGSSDGSATHALIIDADSGVAYVALIAVARRVVRSQSLDQDVEPDGRQACRSRDGQ